MAVAQCAVMLISEGFSAPTLTRVSRLSFIGRLALILQLVVLGPLMLAGSAVFAQETWTVLPTIPTSNDTSTTVQSKAWFHGHTWWTVLATSTPSNGTWLYRLEANNTWTPVLRVTSLKGRADAKAIGDLTHVLIVSSTAQVVTIEYVPALQTYRLWPVNPSPVSVFVGETGSLEVDSTGRLWLATDHFNWVYVYYSDYPYTTFTGPIILTDQTGLGDVNQIVSFPNNTIGVFWGNGVLEHFGFRVHVDGTDPNVWLDDEMPGLAYAGQQMADDHINLQVGNDGMLYAALKAKHPSTNVPPVYLMVRRPNSSGSGGTWDNTLYPVDAVAPGQSESGSGRRPIVVINDDTHTVRVFYHDSAGKIYFRESDADNIAFGPRNQVLDGGFEYVTSTKEPWSGRLVVLATNSGTGGVLITTDPGLVGQWKMEEGSGAIAKDSSGWGNDANLSGSPSWAPSPKGLALDFDGSTDYGVVSDQWALDPTTSLTLSAWIKPQAQGSLDIISRAAAGSVDGYALSLTPSTASTNPRTVVMQFNEASSGNTFRVNSTTQYPTNGSTWMHVAATYDGTTMRMYINGEEERSEVGPASIAANLINVGIGAQSDGTRKFRGQLDDVRIYRRALSATEITELAKIPFGDLRLTKTDGITNIIAGQSTTYTIQVNNVGPDPVRGVVTDSLPSRLSAVTWTCSSTGGAFCTSSGSGSLNDTADLPVGSSVTYLLTGTVTAGPAGTLANTATVSATNGIDPVPDNNSATDTDTIQQPPVPQILTQPSNVTVTAPQSATFTVEAIGAAPLNYQWRRNGSNIAGATSATYVRTPTAVSDSGSTYSVVVSNGGGSVTSTSATLTVSPAPVPPSITTQPSSTLAFEPAAATFSVVATGTSPLSYQWLKNGAPIPGATGTSHTVNPTSGADNNAAFSVVVSNVAGSVTSSAAILSVFGSGSGTVTLLEAHFDSDANGFTYLDDTFRSTAQAQYANGTYLSSGGYTTGALQVVVGGVNSQNISNMSGGWRRSFTIGSNVPLALVFRHRLTEQPTYESDEFSQTLVTLDGVLKGIAPNDYIAQVVGGGPTTTGWQLVQIDLGTVPAGTHVLTLGAYNNKKSYPDESAEVLVDDVLLLANNGPSGPPNITTHPASLTVTAPTSANFTVGATGSAPLSYQWRRNGSAIGGATAQSYSLASTSMSDNGATFDCVVTNGAGSATSATATLTVNAASSPPSITTQPANVTVTAPTGATFSVVAAGTAPLSYQWRRNGAPIAGATGSSYTLTPTSTGDNGASFSVVVSNSAGSITSTAALLTVNSGSVAPSITTQPSAQFVTAPTGATFSVVATGTAPLSYQWRRGGAPIGGATSSSYTLTPTQLSDNGASFDVVVSNSVGNVTSAAASLTVSSGGGGGGSTLIEAHFDADANGFTYADDLFRGTAMPNYASGAYIATGGFTGGGLRVQVAGVNSQNISNMSGGWTRSFTLPSPAPVTLTFRQRLTEQPTYESDEFTQMLVSVDGVLRGVAPNDYVAQVVGGGATTTGWQLVELDLGTLAAGSHTLALGAYNNKKTALDELAEVLIDDVLVVQGGGSSETPPSITTPPASLTVNEPTQATFSVVAAGTAPLSYQWRRNGSNIAGATNSSYTLTPTSSGDNGASFDVVVSNNAGNATSAAATLTVNVAPAITTQPANVTVTQPSSATFSVDATGTGPLGYQWRRNGSNIPGATGSSYVLSPTALSDNGASFDVVVSNVAGIVASSAATLTVNAGAVAPSITTQPANQTVTAPAQATFSVVAAGTAPLSYQWRRNGADIAGANGSSYSLTPTALSDNGASFDVVVSNSAGTVTSSAATLTVLSGGGGGPTLIDAHFDGGADGFVYADDLFRGSLQPLYANGAAVPAGGFSGSGGLQVMVGGLNSQNIQKMSGGWQRSFSLADAASVTLTFRYRLTGNNVRSSRFGQMLVSLNGVLRGVSPNDYVAQVLGGLGGVTSTTDWQQVQINLGPLPAGTHVLSLGGYLNGKSNSNETVEVVIDDVVVTQ
jgi:uncharacterized repeat protein (TIGR01451 family)